MINYFFASSNLIDFRCQVEESMFKAILESTPIYPLVCENLPLVQPVSLMVSAFYWQTFFHYSFRVVFMRKMALKVPW